MYIIVALIMFFKGFADALMMRLQQALSVGDSHGFISAGHFQEVFSAHGTTMIFFVGMGIVFGLLNLIVPLQIGARDVAYPFLNALGFWLFASGSILSLVSLAIGKFSATGWLAYPPLSGIEYSPGEGVDYWIWIVQIAGVGSTLSGINFLGHDSEDALSGDDVDENADLRLERFVRHGACHFCFSHFDSHSCAADFRSISWTCIFLLSAAGGNHMMYVNLIWAWGHPEVYILILPAFGIFSEVVPTFSEKRLFGYVSMVWALIVITFLSFIVWLHHFFTMGASAKCQCILWDYDHADRHSYGSQNF